MPKSQGLYYKPAPNNLLNYISYKEAFPLNTFVYPHPLNDPKFVFGPLRRGWMPARHIFTRGVAGAVGAVRWGESKAEWDAGERNRAKEENALKKAVLADPKMKREVQFGKGRTRVAEGVFLHDIVVKLNEEEQKCVPFLFVETRGILTDLGRLTSFFALKAPPKLVRSTCTTLDRTSRLINGSPSVFQPQPTEEAREGPGKEDEGGSEGWDRCCL